MADEWRQIQALRGQERRRDQQRGRSPHLLQDEGVQGPKWGGQALLSADSCDRKPTRLKHAAAEESLPALCAVGEDGAAVNCAYWCEKPVHEKGASMNSPRNALTMTIAMSALLLPALTRRRATPVFSQARSELTKFSQAG